MLETHCRQYAETREWVVAAVFADVGPLPPLEERKGWTGVQNALAAGTARGVVTWTRSMVAESAEAWERLVVRLGELAWFLAAGALDTPGQALYGRGCPDEVSASHGQGVRRVPNRGSSSPRADPPTRR
ncbi:hypothetical protein [Kitasatospora sp. NPDC088346]|uniref:hypothetical protein n=1 Tax=Kitasatospora sp. NPDC088346 TaxID=3364073 RepID=UPI00381F9EFA